MQAPQVGSSSSSLSAILQRVGRRQKVAHRPRYRERDSDALVGSV